MYKRVFTSLISILLIFCSHVFAIQGSITNTTPYPVQVQYRICHTDIATCNHQCDPPVTIQLDAYKKDKQTSYYKYISFFKNKPEDDPMIAFFSVKALSGNLSPTEAKHNTCGIKYICHAAEQAQNSILEIGPNKILCHSSSGL